MFKREPGRDGNWWIEVVIHGKRIQRSLDTNSAAAAMARAQSEIIAPAKVGRLEPVRPVVEEKFASIGVVMATYREICIGKLPDNTVRANLNSFRLVVRRGLGNDFMTDEAVAALSSSVLSGKLISEFEDWMARKAVVEKRDIEANKRSVEGYIRQARSLFKKTALPRYGEKGVKLPDLDGFMTRAVEKGAKVVKIPPSDELLKATFDEVEKLKKEDIEAFVAWLLCLSSLRRREAGLARFEWIVRTEGRACLVVPPDVAKSDAGRIVPIDERVAEEIEAFRVRRQVGLNEKDERYILPSPRIGQGGPDCRLRAQNIFKRASKWMRARGWRTRKTLHEMRALYLMWVRDSYGLDTAQAVAGHSDQRTTQQNYTGQKAVKGVTITLPLVLAGRDGA